MVEVVLHLGGVGLAPKWNVRRWQPRFPDFKYGRRECLERWRHHRWRFASHSLGCGITPKNHGGRSRHPIQDSGGFQAGI